MLHLGLTGGIGSGKSTAAKLLADLGARVIDADLIAREAVSPGSTGLTQVVGRFGAQILASDGSLDRPALGRIVFADAAARRDLEAIIHPVVRARTAELIEQAPPDSIVVQDVPLIVESNLGPQFHLVLVVGVAEQTRAHRLLRDRGMSEFDAWARIRAQATDEQRRRAADVWLDNDGDLAQLRAQIEQVWSERLVPFEHNVRGGIRVTHPESIELAEPDPTWPDQAARLIARLQHVLGVRALRVDHVGSTAVPGLIAKDVIDLQVGVADLEVADGPDFVEAMAAAGFPLVEGIKRDHSKDGALWPKRFYGSADPSRIAHIHVREVNSRGWRWAIEFRDWLRATPPAMQEYAALKRSLAAAGLTASEYAAAKEPWFDRVHERFATS